MKKMLFFPIAILLSSCAAQLLNNPENKNSPLRLTHAEYVKDGRIYKGTKDSCLNDKRAVNFKEIGSSLALTYYFAYYNDEILEIDYVIERVDSEEGYRKDFVSAKRYRVKHHLKSCLLDNNYIVSVIPI
ncbi:hypothetical protein [Halobacteriovorax sp. JY17]|uniref:hypothetical protein n=1 Tax=Halobacteriovorax sp. JY17 TaxID=2014617 RepID=UPI000C664B18|nr:hypothetical protein [Halobacteriovorax sp. JY17]PIK15103.1 MAG: hypothetical protein CES88_12275 [Halobacteriovorax sp. JY17]